MNCLDHNNSVKTSMHTTIKSIYIPGMDRKSRAILTNKWPVVNIANHQAMASTPFSSLMVSVVSHSLRASDSVVMSLSRSLKYFINYMSVTFYLADAPGWLGLA